MPRPTSEASQRKEQLAPVHIPTPGTNGLRLNQANRLMSPEWCIEAQNCVIDSFGRLAARNGRTTITGATPAPGQVRAIFEYRTATGGTLPIIGYDGGISSSLTAPNGSSLVGTISSVASGRWYFQNFLNKCIGFQSGQKPIVLQNAVGTFSQIVESSGTAPTGGVGCAAYGRLWGVDGDGFTIKYCALTDETNWGSGDSGTIDMRRVWPYGMDQINAIAAFAGMLVVFGTRQIVMYGSNATSGALGLDVTTLRVVDAVDGAGCISQWTISALGGEKERSDLVFCSQIGVISLQRLVASAGSHPIQQLSKNCRDAVIQNLKQEASTSAISGFYSPSQGFYALSLPTSATTWILDQRHKFEDEDGDMVCRMTRWNFATTAMTEFLNRNSYFAGAAVGAIQQYLYGSDDGVGFQLTAQFPWMDMGEELGPRLKALKRIGAILYARLNSNVTLTWYTDFSITGNSVTVATPTGTVAEWNIGQWNIDQWSGGLLLNLVNGNASNTGQYFSLAISNTGDSSFAIQQISLLAKVLRLA